MEREPRMVEESSSSARQLDAARAAHEELSADLVLEILQLTAEGGLRGVQSSGGRDGQASFLCDRHEIAQVTQLHSPMPIRHG
jgi:hypothetical protein